MVEEALFLPLKVRHFCRTKNYLAFNKRYKVAKRKGEQEIRYAVVQGYWQEVKEQRESEVKGEKLRDVINIRMNSKQMYRVMNPNFFEP